jgi:Tfp pilus assembly protein FimT
LAIVLFLVVVLASIAIPNMIAKIPERRMHAAASDVASELRAARVLARSVGRPVAVVLDSSTPSISMRTDSNGNGTYEGHEVSLLDLSNYAGVTASSSVSNGVFDTRGMFSCGDGRWKLIFSTDSGLEEYVYVFPAGFTEQSKNSL